MGKDRSCINNIKRVIRIGKKIVSSTYLPRGIVGGVVNVSPDKAEVRIRFMKCLLQKYNFVVADFKTVVGTIR
jgi:hypothetical protein